MAAAPKSTTPSPAKIALNLDILEREQVRGVPKRKADPFAIQIEGRELTFADPLDVDAPVLMRMEETPERFFGAVLEPDDFDFFMDIYQTPGQMPGWKLSAIMQGYQDHYGLDGSGNARGSRR